jgi:uncharacterized protein (TIGR00369 family)
MPEDKDEFEDRCRASFARQSLMKTLGTRLAAVRPGEAVIELPFRGEWAQQHGFLHAGIIAAISDSARGYPALTLMETDTAVLTVEFKLNLLRPAVGAQFRAVGRVLRAGRTLTVCKGDVYDCQGNGGTEGRTHAGHDCERSRT